MRHRKRKYRVGTSSAHRKSLLRNLMIEILDHEKIKTTHTKCKAVRPYMEKLITLARTDTVANRRKAFSKLNNAKAVQKLFQTAPRYKDRKGGYTRIVKMAENRLGDNAPMSYILLV